MPNANATFDLISDRSAHGRLEFGARYMKSSGVLLEYQALSGNTIDGAVKQMQFGAPFDDESVLMAAVTSLQLLKRTQTFK